MTGLDVVEHLDDDLAGLKRCGAARHGRQAILFVPAFMFLWGVQDDVVIIDAVIPEQTACASRLRVERATYVNLFFAPILLGRLFMRHGPAP